MDDDKQSKKIKLFLPSYIAGWVLFFISAYNQIPFLLGMAIVFMFHALMKNTPVPQNDNGGNDSNE
jgi:hypothetical protein